jgi:uncharacterized membrane protein YphA (DoxX/SURF4 family)
MKSLRIFSRVLLGITFIFSGFVKAVDPLGFAYKFEDYFAAFHMGFLDPVAMYLGVLVCLAEFVIGVALLFGTQMRFFSWAVTLFMSFFFFLTLILAIDNPVSDCGCFGDAIKLSNWETFYKNAVLMVFTLIVFFGRNKFREPYSRAGQTLILGLGAIFLIGTSIYSYRHLPLLDFRPWKEGNKITEYLIASPEESIITLVYQNTESGELLEYTSETLPWQDSVLMAKLEFVEQRKEVIRPYQEAPIHDFEINDHEHNNLTEEVLSNPDFQFLLIVQNVDAAHRESFAKANAIAEITEKAGYSFIALCGSGFEKMDNFRFEVGANYYWYNVDETALKTIIRSNPGLVLLKDGVVLKKWHYNDLPTPEHIKEAFFEKE